jgi:sugar phosphate isomerase/epimerase
MSKELKLCAGAWGFREMEIPVYLDAAKRLGLHHAEMNLTDHPGTRHLRRDPLPDKTDLDAMAKASEASGVKIVCFCAGNDFTVDDPERLKQSIEKAKGYVNVAGDYGVEFVRLVAGHTPFAELRREHYERCARSLAEVGAHAAGKNVTICLENHGGSTGTGAQVKRILELADHPSVTANYDAGNFAICKEDPLSAALVLGDLIGYTHWKDVRVVDGELAYCALGDGVTECGPVVQALLGQGYDGYWGVEYEEPSDVERGTQKCIDVLLAAANV